MMDSRRLAIGENASVTLFNLKTGEKVLETGVKLAGVNLNLDERSISVEMMQEVIENFDRSMCNLGEDYLKEKIKETNGLGGGVAFNLSNDRSLKVSAWKPRETITMIESAVPSVLPHQYKGVEIETFDPYRYIGMSALSLASLYPPTETITMKERKKKYNDGLNKLLNKGKKW